MRIFEAPTNFNDFLTKEYRCKQDFEIGKSEKISLPTLGLTNKVISYRKKSFDNNTCLKCDHFEYGNEPSVEENLVRNTLWPEIQKLYGHGSEISALASRNDCSFLATSAKSTNLENAVIILWDTKSWSQSQKLLSHVLTVTQLAFSPNDLFLLSVSRDRKWTLFFSSNNKYELHSTIPDNCFHKRIIWCCAWTPDSECFTTGSRDGTLCIWNNKLINDQNHSPALASFDRHISITALSFASKSYAKGNYYILAVGYEYGVIDVGKIQRFPHQNIYKWQMILSLNQSVAHHLAVRKIAFRPKYKKYTENKITLQLATCGDDNAVKIFDITI